VLDRVETERLILLPATTHDVDRMVELDADAQVMRFITGGLPTSRADVEHRVRETRGFLFVATELASGEFVGWFSIRPSAPAERELGYRLRRRSWGRGLAAEGARAMIEAAFSDPDVSRVWAQTMTVNAASRRVMERCGLRFVRTFFEEWPGGPIEGSDLGDVEYELLRTDWQQPRQSTSD
jgi:RimJ/RimL family protein N-acetyltransferase